MAATEMRAVYYGRHMGKLTIGRLPRPPPPGAGQLLIRVRAASLNPVDYKTASGAHMLLFNFAWPRVVGFDFSGEVEAVGEHAEFAPGELVFGQIRGLPQLHKGTLADYVLVEADVCARCPAGSSHAECAALPLCAITAATQLRACGLVELGEGERGNTKEGPRVLITCGAGGVGTAAIQLAKAMFGAREVVVTASPAKAALCESLGADRVVDYHDTGADGKTPWYKKLADEIASGKERGFDAVLVATDGEVGQCARAGLMATGGALCSVMPPPTVEGLRKWMEETQPPRGHVAFGVQPFLRSAVGGWLLNATVGARGLRRVLESQGARYEFVVGGGNGELVRKFAALMAAGKLRAAVEKTYDFDQSLDAIAHLKSGRVAGKLVVLLNEDKATAPPLGEVAAPACR